MIKGINNYVIEVCDTGNEYYDKAILFVKPEYADVQKMALEKEAKKLLKNIDTTASMKRHKCGIKQWVRMSVAAGVGAIASALLVNFLWLH